MKTQSRLVRIFRGCMLIVLSSCFINGTSLAEPQETQEEDGFDYAPLFAPEQVHPLQPAACEIETVTGFVMDTNMPTIAHCGKHDITLTGISKARKVADDEAETTHVAINLKGPQQRAVEAVLRLKDFPAGYVDAVAFADLNGDGKDDFILNLGDHGNGLAAEIGGMLFLISGADGYRYLGMAEVMQNISRYVRFGDSKTVVLVLQRLAKDKNGGNSIKGSDNKSHTFFVFDLLDFDVTAAKGAKLNNRLDARFPFWTLYTDEPSRSETKLLGASTRKALWRDPLLRVVSGKLVEH